MDSSSVQILSISLNSDWNISLAVSPWLWLSSILLIALLASWKLRFRKRLLHHFELVSVDIQLGNVGRVSLKPNSEDVQIAHKVWTELVTRKAALPIDEENDVIIEIYDSWYALFTTTRKLIASIPGKYVHKEASTRELVRIAIQTLNDGLRPHLTRWHARFRNWYRLNHHRLEQMTPQELQKEFPEFDGLLADMKRVNEQLIQYASELKRIAHGDSQ